MESFICRRAAIKSFEPEGSPPTTRTRHCACSSCASSIARRLSSSQSFEVKKPPRHKPVTVRPCFLMEETAFFIPISATWSRHAEIPRMPWRAQPSIACARFHWRFTVTVLSDSSEGSGALMWGRLLQQLRREQLGQDERNLGPEDDRREHEQHRDEHDDRVLERELERHLGHRARDHQAQ